MKSLIHTFCCLIFFPLACGLLAQTPSKTIALKAAWLWDGKSETRIPDGVVLIDGERIISAGSRLAIPDGARVIELGSATILPGLIDAHTHLMLDEDVRLTLPRLDLLWPLIHPAGTAGSPRCT